MIRAPLRDWATSADYATLLRAALAEMTSVLDVGCGRESVVPSVVGQITEVVGIDILDQPLPPGYSRYVRGDVRDLSAHFSSASFDCVLALDVIEHLSKEDGHAFLAALERIARKRVIVFTPNGFLTQEPYDDNPFQEHLSGWEVDELMDYGFEVVGVNGWRPLRGQYANIRFKPGWFWSRVSLLSQPLVVRHPRLAFQLLGMKELTD